jgi:CheY-like chemotaxis protein
LPARILVVDDDPLNAELICEILRSAGMDASFLTSSTEAAARLKREKYHAVFLDMRMPTPDGAELARQIRVSHVNSSPNAFSPPQRLARRLCKCDFGSVDGESVISQSRQGSSRKTFGCTPL